MTEFTLSAYLIASSTAVSGAFGAQDDAVKSHVMTQTAPLIERRGGSAGLERVTDGLDRILSTPRFETYNYNAALAVEMLYATYGTPSQSPSTTVILGFTEDCLPALSALNLPSIHKAMDVLAWGHEVALPVPMDRWDDVSGQYYFDATAQIAALSELAGLGDIPNAVAVLEQGNAEVFDDCDPADLETQLMFLQPLLSEAQSRSLELALFRHGGV
ncbi:MAG: hypothetical protein AB8B82_16595 [Roseovarius sp.]